MLQRGTRITFREATVFAKRVLKDPVRKAYYQNQARELKLPNAYTAAITEFMRGRKAPRPPMIRTITTANYPVRRSSSESDFVIELRDAFAWRFPLVTRTGLGEDVDENVRKS
jgi:hypothetical protein